MASITGANSTFTLSISGLFNTPVQLQGYAVDDAFATEPLKPVETMLGVDGILAGGMVYVEVPQTISLLANSPSIAIFDQWFAAQQNAVDTYVASGLITLPSLKLKYQLVTGYLTSYSPISDVKKLLQSRKFGLTWQTIVPQNIL